MSEEQQTQSPVDADSAGQIDAGAADQGESMATQQDSPIEAPAGSDTLTYKAKGRYNLMPAEAATQQVIIPPTIGRKVWFRPGSDWPSPAAVLGDQPLDATVVFVWDDRTVNLAVRDHAGASWQAANVPLVQPGDEIPAGSHATWIDYQLQQAAAGK